MQRRAFLRASGGAVGAGTLALNACGEKAGHENRTAPKAVAGLPRRRLATTGPAISIVGFPGLALIHGDQKRCTAALHAAWEQGVNYFDVAPAYGKGDAEIKMGIGLQGIRRDDIFLSCKTKMRDKKGAREELERSLKRLKTDRFDLYQMHCLKRPEEVAQALGPGGAIETFLEARQQGTVRFLGFSAHTTKAALAALEGFDFDTVMFPVNFVEYFRIGFGKPVLKRAREKGADVLAIKALCRGAWPKGMKRTRRWWYRPVEDEQEIDLAIRFTLSQANVRTALPPAWLDLAEKAITAGGSFRPVTDAETATIRKLADSCFSIFKREEDRVAAIPPAYRFSCPCADDPCIAAR